MPLILRESEVRQLLSMSDCIDLVEEAHRLHAKGEAILAPRLALSLGGDVGTFRIMAASLPEMSTFGLKTLTGIPGRRLPEFTHFTILVFDGETGGFLGLLPPDTLPTPAPARPEVSPSRKAPTSWPPRRLRRCRSSRVIGSRPEGLRPGETDSSCGADALSRPTALAVDRLPFSILTSLGRTRILPNRGQEITSRVAIAVTPRVIS